MHPLKRIFLGAVCATIVFFLIPSGKFSPLLTSMVVWVVFASVFNLTSWIVLFKQPIEGIRKVARSDDGSKLFVFVMILMCAFSSMGAVLLLLISEKSKDTMWSFPISVLGMLLSWAMVHTIFAFHYAHMYYDDANDFPNQPAGGLDFPKEPAPDYVDFAYFSFVIGCTFQVSDVEITSRSIRRQALLHGLISFVFNTFIVALIINLIAGLNR